MSVNSSKGNLQIDHLTQHDDDALNHAIPGQESECAVVVVVIISPSTLHQVINLSLVSQIVAVAVEGIPEDVAQVVEDDG